LLLIGARRITSASNDTIVPSTAREIQNHRNSSVRVSMSVSLYCVCRTHCTEQAQRQAVAQTLDSGIEGRLAKSVAEIAKSTGADPDGRAEFLANHINAEKDRLPAAGYYDTLWKEA
jgi:hypothetical protein